MSWTCVVCGCVNAPTLTHCGTCGEAALAATDLFDEEPDFVPQQQAGGAGSWPIHYAAAASARSGALVSKPSSASRTHVDGTVTRTYDASALCKPTALLRSNWESAARPKTAELPARTVAPPGARPSTAAPAGAPAAPWGSLYSRPENLAPAAVVPPTRAPVGLPRNPWELAPTNVSAPSPALASATGMQAKRTAAVGVPPPPPPPGLVYPLLDEAASETWEYPTSVGYSDRQYQVEIASVALFQNTLVSLPTGLGKTFIAAVVMHNYYRWFPQGQIVFLAPTRPLVTQQIEACFRIVGMSAHDTAQMQGSMKTTDRTTFWKQRRVFYCTPQTFCNDITAGRVDPCRVVLVVLDEAHRATKAHSYVQCIRALDARHGRYRVLALSATPGSDLNQVADVVNNLHISRIEVRTHDDESVAKYRNETTIDKIIVPLSKEIEELRNLFAEIMNVSIILLSKADIILRMAPTRINTMQLLKAREDLAAARKTGKGPIAAMTEEQYRNMTGHLSLLLNFAPAMRELLTHGTMAFYASLKRIEAAAATGRVSRARQDLLSSMRWRNIMTLLASMDVAGAHSTHPKLLKLLEVLQEHFKRKAAAGVATRAIVFTQTRSSVHEILTFMQTCAKAGVVPTMAAVDPAQPTITTMFGNLAGHPVTSAPSGGPTSLRPAAFVGQARGSKDPRASAWGDDEDGDGNEMDDGLDGGDEDDPRVVARLQALSNTGEDEDASAVLAAFGGQRSADTSAAASAPASVALRGQTQKEQVATIEAFRRGEYNVLVATCIGEEGLDIGEVGIIVMFDAVKSPIRMIQRLGRTGRKTAGECVSLVTAAESEKFEESFRNYRRIAAALKQRADTFKLYDADPVLVRVPSSMKDAAVAVRFLPDPGAEYNHALMAVSALTPLRVAPPIPAALCKDFMESLISGAYTRLPNGDILPRMARQLLSGGDYHASQVAGIARQSVAPDAKERHAVRGLRNADAAGKARTASAAKQVFAGWATSESQLGFLDAFEEGDESEALCIPPGIARPLAAICRSAGALQDRGLTAGALDTHMPHNTCFRRSARVRALMAALRPSAALLAGATMLLKDGEKRLWATEAGFMSELTVRLRRPSSPARRDEQLVTQGAALHLAASPMLRVMSPRPSTDAVTAAPEPAPVPTQQKASSLEERVLMQQKFTKALRQLLQELGRSGVEAMSFNQVAQAVEALCGVVVPPKSSTAPNATAFRSFCKTVVQDLLGENDDIDAVAPHEAVPEDAQADVATQETEDSASTCSTATLQASDSVDEHHPAIASPALRTARAVLIVASPEGDQEVDRVARKPTTVPTVCAPSPSGAPDLSTQPIVRRRRRLGRQGSLPVASPENRAALIDVSSPASPKRNRVNLAVRQRQVSEVDARQAAQARARYLDGAADHGGNDSGSDDDRLLAHGKADADSDEGLDNDSGMNEYDLNDSFINDGTPTREDDTQSDGGYGQGGSGRKRARMHDEDTSRPQSYHVQSLMFSQWDGGDASPTAALGKIRGRGNRKNMPILSRLMEHVARGDRFDDDDSEVGSSLDDRDSDDASPSPVGSSQDTQAHRVDDEDDLPLSLVLSSRSKQARTSRGRKRTAALTSATNSCAVHVDVTCANCEMSPIRGTRYMCLVCASYSLCEDCHKHRGIIHTEELGYDRHPFRAISEPLNGREQTESLRGSATFAAKGGSAVARRPDACPQSSKQVPSPLRASRPSTAPWISDPARRQHGTQAPLPSARGVSLGSTQHRSRNDVGSATLPGHAAPVQLAKPAAAGSAAVLQSARRMFGLPAAATSAASMSEPSRPPTTVAYTAPAPPPVSMLPTGRTVAPALGAPAHTVPLEPRLPPAATASAGSTAPDKEELRRILERKRQEAQAKLLARRAAQTEPAVAGFAGAPTALHDTVKTAAPLPATSPPSGAGTFTMSSDPISGTFDAGVAAPMAVPRLRVELASDLPSSHALPEMTRASYAVPGGTSCVIGPATNPNGVLVAAAAATVPHPALGRIDRPTPAPPGPVSSVGPGPVLTAKAPELRTTYPYTRSATVFPTESNPLTSPPTRRLTLTAGAPSSSSVIDPAGPSIPSSSSAQSAAMQPAAVGAAPRQRLALTTASSNAGHAAPYPAASPTDVSFAAIPSSLSASTAENNTTRGAAAGFGHAAVHHISHITPGAVTPVPVPSTTVLPTAPAAVPQKVVHAPKTRAEAQVRNLLRIAGMTEPLARLIVGWLDNRPFSEITKLTVEDAKRYAAVHMQGAFAGLELCDVARVLDVCRARAAPAGQGL